MKLWKLTIISIFLLIVILVLSMHVVSIIVSPSDEAIVYATDENKPLSLRDQVDVVFPGDKLKVVECIDSKSDQYLHIITPSGEDGYLYALDNSVSVSLSFDSSITPSNLIKCALFLSVE